MTPKINADKLATQYAASQNTQAIKAYWNDDETLTVILESGPKVRLTEDEIAERIKQAAQERKMQKEIDEAIAAIQGAAEPKRKPR